jgi:hypothetical protein
VGTGVGAGVGVGVGVEGAGSLAGGGGEGAGSLAGDDGEGAPGAGSLAGGDGSGEAGGAPLDGVGAGTTTEPPAVRSPEPSVFSSGSGAAIVVSSPRGDGLGLDDGSSPRSPGGTSDAVQPKTKPRVATASSCRATRRRRMYIVGSLWKG